MNNNVFGFNDNFNNNFNNNCGNGLNNPNILGQPNTNFNNNNVNSNCGNGVFNQGVFLQNNQQPQVPEAEENTIFVTFTFKKNKKQLFIDVSPDSTFADAIFILENKYEWLKALSQRNYSIHINNNNEKPIQRRNYNTTLKDLDINESSDIWITDELVQDIKTNNKANNINNKRDMSKDRSREIAVNFKICQKLGENEQNTIDIDCPFQANNTVKDVLSSIINDQTKLINDLQKGKFFFASKGKTQQNNKNGEMGEVEANIVPISESDLNKNMDTYINNYRQLNPLDDDKNFVIWYVEDNFYDKENPPDRKRQYLKTANNKTNRSRKNKWLLVIGVVVLIFGIIALAIELLVLKAALIIMIIGLFIACIGFFWGDLPCCSRLNFRMGKPDYSSGSQRNMMYNRDDGYPRQSEYDNIQNLQK